MSDIYSIKMEIKIYNQKLAKKRPSKTIEKDIIIPQHKPLHTDEKTCSEMN
jgi:hypothetical protein